MKRSVILLICSLNSIAAGSWNLGGDTNQQTSSGGWSINNAQNTSSQNGSSSWSLNSQDSPHTTESDSGAWQLATPSQNPPANVGGSSGWSLVTTSSPLTTQSAQSQSWSLAAAGNSGVHIYQTQTFKNIEGKIFSLQFSIGEALQTYTGAQAVAAQGAWTLATGNSNAHSATGHQQATQSQQSDFNYGQHFHMFLQYITADSNSYLDFTRQMFTAYSELYPMYQQSMVSAGKQVNPDAVNYYRDLPFQNDAVTLQLLQGAIGALLDFLTMRLKLVTITNYGSTPTQNFFVGNAEQQVPSTLAQLQTAVNTFETLFKTQYDAQQVRGLSDNYTKIINSYKRGQNLQIVQFALKLLKYLKQQYPMSLALNPEITEIDINFTVLNQLYTLCQQGIQMLKDDPNPPQFDSYSSLDATLNDIRLSMAGLFAYAGTVGQNSIKKDVIAKGKAIDSAQTQSKLELLSQFYANAASYYLNAGDNLSYNAYYTFSKNLMLGSQAWKSGQVLSAQGSYQQAAERYDFGHDILKQVGSTELAILLLQLANDANLSAAQQGLTLYSKYTMYQQNIGQYVSAAQQVPTDDAVSQENLLQDVFYTSNNKIYQGIAVLAGGVVPSYSTILNGLQSGAQDADAQKKLQLKNAITVLDSMRLGAQEIFITSTDSGGSEAAYTNIYGNYYDPEKVFEGQLSFLDVITNFSKTDAALAAVQNNPYAPLGQLFNQSSVKTFAGLGQLNLARLSLMSGKFAWQLADSSDPSYAEYKQPCTVSALLSLLCAQKVYAFLQNQPLTDYCQNELKKLTPQIQLVLQDAQARINGDTSNQNQYEIALLECLGAALLADASAPNQLNTIITSYTNALTARTWDVEFPKLQAAYAHYRGYLWALYAQDTAGATEYKNALAELITNLASTIDTLKSTANNTAKQYEERIAAQLKLKSLEQDMHSMLTNQNYDQALFNLSNQNFCTVTKSNQNGVEQSTFTFVSGQSITLPNASYQLAQLYVEQAESQLALLQQDFDSATPDYSKETSEAFTLIVSNYQKALSNYGELGLQDKVLETEQDLTKAIAFRYLSLVIPSDQVRNKIHLQQVATITSSQSSQQGSQQSGSWTLSAPPQQNESNSSGGWVLSGNNQSNQSGGGSGSQTITLEQTLPLNFPSYLLRFWQTNITEEKDKADAVAAQYQSNASEGQSIPPAVSQKQEFYANLLTAASGLIGKTDPESMSKLVTDIAVPLYKEEITVGGFQPVFRTLDEEVELYKTQLAYMIGTGMQVAGKTFKSSLKLETQKDAQGKDQVLLTGSFMPLGCIPRFQNDFRNALFYYQIYKKFFTPSTQPVSIGGGLYFPINNEQQRLRAQKESERAYLASTILFDEEIAGIVQPLSQITSQQRATKQFKDYEDTYKKLAKAYEWILATYSGIDTMQQSSGVSYIDINKRRQDIYQEYAKNCRLFLFGTPLVQEYESVVKDVVNNYLFAAEYAVGSGAGAFKNSMYQKSAQLNLVSGDWCTKQNQLLPSSDNYPSPAATNLPGNVTVATREGLTCGPAPTYTWPAGTPTVWKYYQEAQGYYSEAMHLYKEGYKAANSQSLAGMYNNPDILLAAGKSIMASVRAGLQRVILFTKNAVEVHVDDADGGKKYGVFITEKFDNIKKDGASGGAVGAIQGAQNLTSGSGGSVNQHAVAQFRIMKKLVLDALIYLSPAPQAINDIVQGQGGIGTSQDASKQVASITGKSIQCASAYNFPDLSTLVSPDANKSQQQAQVVPLYALSEPSMVDLVQALTPNWQLILQYADTYSCLVEYVINDLIGNESSKFSKLGEPKQAAAFSSFLGQLNGLWRNLYGSTFLTDLQGKAGVDAVSQIETSINTALNAEKQQLLVDPTGYVG